MTSVEVLVVWAVISSLIAFGSFAIAGYSLHRMRHLETLVERGGTVLFSEIKEAKADLVALTTQLKKPAAKKAVKPAVKAAPKRKQVVPASKRKKPVK